MAFAWKELKDIALSRPEAERFPVIEELGPLDFGAFANREFLSVAKVAQLRKLHAISEGGPDMPSDGDNVAASTAAATS